MDILSQELKQYLLKFLGISELMNMADTSMEWRKLVGDQVFLDDICRRRFGLRFAELPELSKYEKLLINTQQLVFQAKHPKFFGVHPSLAKIYAMELRSSWFPYVFKGSNVAVSGNIALRDLKYPWPYDQSIGESPFYRETKKFSARIHAAFPVLFETLVNSSRKQGKYGKFGYITENYPPIIESIAAAEEIDIGLNDRQPRIIEIITPSNAALFFFIYDDDESLRVVFRDLEVNRSQISSGIIPWKATLEEIRAAICNVIPHFCNLVTALAEYFHGSTKCPSMGPMGATQADIHLFQLELVKVLEEEVQMRALELENFGYSVIGSDPDQQRHDQSVQNLIKSVDSLYPCDSSMHDHSDGENLPSKDLLSIAIFCALRRLINREFLPEVKNLHGNKLTRLLVHAWSWQGKGGQHRLCYETSAPPGFDFNQKCIMKETVSNSICCRQGFVDLWPAVTLRKAIDQMPKLVKELESNVVKIVSRFNRYGIEVAKIWWR